MIRVDIETIIMAAGPVPSVIVLRERSADGTSDAPLRALSIQTGSFEAAAVGRGKAHRVATWAGINLQRRCRGSWWCCF